MLRFITISTLLVLTLATKDHSSLCSNNGNLPRPQLDLIKNFERISEGVSNLIPAQEHQKLLQKFKKSIKNELCESKLKPKMISSITKFFEHVKNQLDEGSLKSKDVIRFLEQNKDKSLQKIFDHYKS
ncbi:uncharacterized protein O3C94_022596 [Discoglossus pictus]